MIKNRLIGYSLIVILIICCSPFKFGNAEELMTSSKSTTSTTTSQYSGGLWIGNSNQVALVGYNASFIISEFSVKNYNYSYFLSVPEINWNYFSYYNASTKGAIECKIMRSRPDGTNIEFIANSVYLNLSSNYYVNQMTVCKFAIDLDNNYLYYASKDQVIRSLLNGGDPVAFKTLSAGYNIIGVQIDSVYKHIVFSYLTTSGYAYIEGVAISNNQSYVYSKYISSLVYDFAVYNESLAFVTPYSYYYTYVYYYPNVITSYYSTSITWGYSTFSVSVDSTNGIFYAASYSYHTLTSWNTTSSSPLPISTTLSYYGTIRFISVQTSYCSGDCFGRGECISTSSSPSPSTFSCQCSQNYYSSNCSVYCVDSYCHNGGHCNSNGFCDCPTDYYGDYCTCSFDICNKNGDCSSSGLCQCNTYYSGQYCQSPVITPTTPRTFEATAVVNSVKSSFYYSYSSQIIVIKYDDYSVMYDYIAGYEYNYTSTSCLKSELSVAVLLPLQPTSTSHLIYWNGTNSDMNCELNSVSIWVDSLPAPTSTLFMQQSCLSSTGYVPLFYADEFVSTSTISFNTQSFNFNPPSSVFSVPSICSN